MQSVYFANVSLAKQLYNFTDYDNSLLFNPIKVSLVRGSFRWGPYDMWSYFLALLQ